MQKAAAYKVQGMYRDASPSNFKPEYAFEIVNMRLITDEEGTAFSLVNEKGTKYECPLEENIQWTPIGQCPTTDSIVVFATSNTTDAIFNIKEEEGKWVSKKLYEGDLKFQADKPIETLFNYETENLQKVYWIDGINPLRCINLAQESYKQAGNGGDTQFDSVSPMHSNQVTAIIERVSGGSFKAGVIQYYLTYFNKYKTESPIVWISPLLYLANQDRGAETDANVNTAFKFDILGLDSVNWEYVRLYSVFRASIDTEPSANIVTELKLDGTTVTAFDYGTSNTAIVASDLYFVGAKAVKAGTMTVKDQVLFLGNLKVDSKIEPEPIDRSTYDLKTDTYKSRPFKISETEGTYYKYDNQLDNTESISTYKNGETYRFGYQLQDKWGNWSNPIFIEDKEINFAPKMDYSEGEFLQLAQPSMDISSYVEEFTNQGYIAARPLVVYPEVRDRKILCQGVVCPTIYNLKDRVDNSPYTQASWFMRPNIPGDIWGQNNEDAKDSWSIYGHKFYKNNFSTDTEYYGQTGLTENGNNIHDELAIEEEISRGSWVEFRHNYALKPKGYSYMSDKLANTWYPGIPTIAADAIDRVSYTEKFYKYARGTEIDATRGIATMPVNMIGPILESKRLYAKSKAGNSLMYVEQYNTGSSAYYVDSNIVTLNSPEIELVEDLYTIPTENYKFRIVGMVPLTANVGDISLEVKNPDFYDHDKSFEDRGFQKIDVRTENIGHSGYRGMVAQSVYNAWRQEFKIDDNGDEVAVANGNHMAAHLLYPWHITGNIQTFRSSSNKRTSHSQLKRKVLSNLRFSAISYYLPKASYWKPSFEDTSRIISWTSTDNSIQKFQIPESLNIPDIVYKGNIDSLAMQHVESTGGTSYDLFYYAGESESYGAGEDISAIEQDRTYTTNSNIVQKGMSLAASIKYKSSPHYAIFLGGITKEETTFLEISPAIRWQYDRSYKNLNLEGHTIQEIESKNFSAVNVYENQNVSSINIQTAINLEKAWFVHHFNLPIEDTQTSEYTPINYGWLWLGEIYKDNAPTFGGNSEYALLNNKWEIAGSSISLGQKTEGRPSSKVLKWSIGDTYYQRFDTLKTYAYSDTDENSVIDITSFMVETRLNLDGRYDRNRGQENNLSMSPKNFNLFNKVYTQKNNFFTYSMTSEEAAGRLKFPTQITWSLVKTPGENIDQWLNTTMSALLDLDGRKGSLTSLETMGNEIIAFQEKGIANIIYNPRTQITATDGTPIYIANSTKVEGFRYISDSVGSQDKWSIVSTPNGLYFVDLYNKGIYKFNGQLEDISNAQGFHSWCIQNLNKDSKILGYYDYKNKDVYFINTDWDYPCLAFSEFTNTFSSFYSYENAKLAYLQGEGIWIKDDGSIYTHQTGSYNSFFGKNGEDYHVTIVCNQDGNLSKIFNNIEFRADSWEGNTAVADKSIDYLAIETEYQKKTEEPLVFKKHGISNLKKKFNVWRANIPREQGTRNRFRDVWAKVTLGSRGNARKTRLNDIVVYYT